MALAGNKNDMYEHEEVEENEGKELGKEIGAIFERTSAKESIGIEDLFNKIGQKYIEQLNDSGNSGNNKDSQGSKKLENINGKMKKGCC